MAMYPQRLGQADCRDFLRTGRCKYGESCKYHHPANVQVGGGIRTPLDPSEPPFPIRPDEPHCQYYLKHGTCKFGQTCRFHHPANLVGIGSCFNCKNSIGNTSHPASVGSLNSSSSMGSDVMVLLPQRPNEPDCIYFLRNGRCKYGSTCKFHHPLAYHSIDIVTLNGNTGISQRAHDDERLNHARGRAYSIGSTHDSSSRNGSGGTAVQFLSSSPSLLTSSQHGSGNHSGPTHILVSDGPLAIMMNRASDHSGSSTFHDRNRSHGVTSQRSSSDQTSSVNGHMLSSPVVSSSLESSYDGLSSFEYLGAGNSSGEAPINVPIWHRSSSQGNASTLATANNSSQTRHRGLPHRPSQPHYVMVRRSSNSDHVQTHDINSRQSSGNTTSFTSPATIDPRNRRTVSLGSSADMAMTSSLEGSNNLSSIHRGWNSNASLSTSSSRFWEENNLANNSLLPESIEHTPSFDNVRGSGRGELEDFRSEDGLMWRNNYDDEQSNASITCINGMSNAGNHLYKQDQRIDWNSAHENEPNLSEDNLCHSIEDDGLSTMTSALLNMLDTSDDLDYKGNASSSPQLSSNHSRRNHSRHSFSAPEYVAVGMSHTNSRAAQSMSSLSSIKDKDSFLVRAEVGRDAMIMNTPSTPHLSRQTVINSHQQRQSKNIIPPPQTSPSNIGLYLS